MIYNTCQRKIIRASLLAGAVFIGAGASIASAQSIGAQPENTAATAQIVASLNAPSKNVGIAPAAARTAPLDRGPVALALNALFTGGKAGVPAAIEAAYRANGMQPLWLDQANIAIVTQVLARAADHGLSPARYALPIGASAGSPVNPQITARDDLAVSKAVFAYLSDVRLGVLRPGIRGRDTVLVPKKIDMQALFAGVAADPLQGLEAAAPPTAAYRNLVKLLAVARADLASGEWGTVSPKGRSLHPGKKDRRIPQILARLAASGEYTGIVGDDGSSLIYGPELVEAVKAFQARQGLGVDGVAGRRTVTAMNITAAKRVEQVIANLERERWQPEDVPARLVEVNVPAYRLEARDAGVRVIDMDVIVGRKRRPTPIFADSIRFVEFNPTWTVPKKLAAEDIGPAVIKDPGYLARKGFTIYSSWKRGATVVDPSTIDWSIYNKSNIPFRLVQAPGKKNALGSVKFLFPNKFAVYLHDTPGKNLFLKAIRAISSGCVRVKDPRGFANYLLSGQLDEVQIDKAFARKRTRRVTLQTPVTVRLIYRTAWLGEAGETQYRADVYGRDKKILKKLRAKGLTF